MKRGRGLGVENAETPPHLHNHYTTNAAGTRRREVFFYFDIYYAVSYLIRTLLCHFFRHEKTLSDSLGQGLIRRMDSPFL